MPNIHQTVLIGATAEKVYHAITSQEGLSGCWTPGSTTKPDINSLARFPFGPTYFKEMKIIELKPFKQVKWHCMKGADEWIGTTLSFKLESGDNSSLQDAHPEMPDQHRIHI